MTLMLRLLAGVALAAVTAGPASASDAPVDRPTIPILDALTLTASCTQALDDARSAMHAIEQIPLAAVTPANVLDAWDASTLQLRGVVGPVSLLNAVHPDKGVRDAAEACGRHVSAFGTELYQNEALYARVKAVEAAPGAQGQLQRDLLDNFEDTGVSLAAEKRARFKEIVAAITRLSQEFSRNLRDNPARVTFTPEECRGLPKAWLDRAKRDERGRIVVGFDYPEYMPFMENAEDEAARQRYYEAFANRGTPRNLAILDEIVRLRQETARLYGMPSYAHLVTRRRMVETPETVATFLADVKEKVAAVERRDVEELRALKARVTGTPVAEVTLHRWDVAFYTEKLRRERYSVDQEELRKYFPTEPTVDWVIDLSARLYGLKFAAAAVPVWHPDVRYYDVSDGTTGQFLGGVYLDLFPREGKYKHAAAWAVRPVSRRVGQTPISALVTNFDRRGFTQSELETFFHEFGHVLHNVLSTTHYGEHAGTATQRDFVEAPSQIYEEWARRLDTLSTLQESCAACPVIDKEMVERLDAARRFGRGVHYGRQWLYSAFDMALAGPDPKAALETWRQMEGDTPMGHPAGTEFPGTFAHIVSGYAAGYYGYMWSEVIALDMLSAYGDTLMNPSVGRKFRAEVLSRGGEEPGRHLVERFLGRPVRSDAFFAEIEGRRRGKAALASQE